MGDQQHRFVFALCLHSLEDDPLVQAVQIGGRLVQQQKRCIVQERTRHTDALTLAAGKGTAQLTHRGVIALGQAADETIQCSFFAGRFHLFPGGIPLCNADVVLDGVIEQFGLLGHKALLRTQGGGVHPADILFPKADAAAGHIPEPHQPQEGRLSAARTARDAHDLLFQNGQAQVMQDLLFGIGKAHMLCRSTCKGGVCAVGHIHRDRLFLQQVQNTVGACEHLRQADAKVCQCHHRAKGAQCRKGAHQHPLPLW